MKYALLIYQGELTSESEQFSEAERKSIVGEYVAIMEERDVLATVQLQPAASTTTIRVENGTTLTTDGPFANTKEVLGGFYLLEADNLDRALEIAARIPAARLGGAVEVRPLVEL
jgi:hypothetical protein